MTDYGLLTTTATGGADYAATSTQGNSESLSADIEVSHLDSFFANSGWTREDLMLVLGTAQVLAWLALLYLEVRE